MRVFIIIFFVLLAHKSAYVQKNTLRHSVANTPVFSYASIDRLNAVAHDIFLRSPDSARKIAAKALLLSESANYAYGKGSSFLNIGVIYWSQSYYPISLFYLKSALTYLPANKQLDISDTYRALGRTYADLKDDKQALYNLNKAQYFAGKDTGRLAEVYSERAYVYCDLKNYNKALWAAKYSLKLNRRLKAHGNIAVLYGRLGLIYYNKKAYQAALAYDDTAYNMSLKTRNRRLQARSYGDYALINNKLGKFDIAIKYAQKAIALADSMGIMDVTTTAYKALVNSFELKNDLPQALTYQRKYNSVRDSLSTAAKLKTVVLIQNYYDLNSKMNGIKLMELNDRDNKAKIKSQNTLILFLFIFLVVVMAMLFATYYLYKQKKILSNRLQLQHTALLDQKKVIEVQTTNLQQVNNLKDKLLAVIGHDLRTPVANLTNIIEMFDTGYLTANDVHDLMKDISPIVKGAELTLSNLVEWAGSQIKGRSIESSNVDIFLLGMEMEQTFMHGLHQKSIEYINHAYPGQAVLADENHLKVILRNLISNAIKFTDQKGSITLASIIQNNELIVSVTDSGKGMTTDEMDKLFCLNTHFSYSGTSGEKGTGIGLLLCKELVELNGGKIGVKSVVGKGSTFFFNLPLMKAYA